MTENWEWRMVALQNGTDAEDLTGILVARVGVYEQAEQFWILKQAIIAAGIRRPLETGDVLEIPNVNPARPKEHPCNCLWEVMGYSKSLGSYWVRPLRVPDHVPA